MANRSVIVSGSEEFWNRFKQNDLQGALEILKQSGARINSPGPHGLTPIQAAARRGNAEIVAELLKRDDLQIGDALLHAVKNGDQTIVEMILDFMKRRRLPSENSFDNAIHFKFYMTPLMLACLEENFALVDLFLKQGHVLTLPHGSECCCSTCVKDHPNGEKLEDKLRRIDSYAAACSLPFVLQQEDPFDYVMAFTRYLKESKKYEPIFSARYSEIIGKLNNIMISLISDCDKQEAIETILYRPPKSLVDGECVFGYPRIEQAVRSYQKQFLAQPNCQSVIYTAYCGQWKERFHWGRVKRIGCFFMHTILFPITSLVYVLSFGNFPSSFKNPITRALTSFSSYVLFLSVLIFYTQYKEARWNLGKPELGSKAIALTYLFSYVAGTWLIFLTDLRRLGGRMVFSVWWRRFDFVFLMVWSCTLFAFFDAVYRAGAHNIHTLHRVHWSPDEPQLIYEIFFTWAAIMSSVRFLYYGQLLDHFGVVTVSILQCIPTILRYVIVLFVVLASFAIGLNHLYEHYKDNVITRDGKDFYQPFQLTSIFTTARYLYWAYYGYLPPETWPVVVGEIVNGTNRDKRDHPIITYAGEFMSGVYHVIELIILLNLMVAIMTAAAVSVIDKESIEWKFVRVAIWTEYFQDSRIIPPPFNLLQLLINGSVYAVRKVLRRKEALSAWDFKYEHPTSSTEKGKLLKQEPYNAMVSTLKNRLLASKMG